MRCIVETRHAASLNETLYLGHLPTGIYFFHLQMDGRVKTMKAVKR